MRGQHQDEGMGVNKRMAAVTKERISFIKKCFARQNSYYKHRQASSATLPLSENDWTVVMVHC